MSSDLLTLTALRDKQKYRTLLSSVPSDMLGSEARCLLEWYAVYWSTHPESEYIDLDALTALIKLRSGYEKETLILLQHQLTRMQQGFPEDAVKGVVRTLTEMTLSGKTSRLIADYANGKEIDLAYELAQLSQETLRTISQATPTDWINEDVAEILKREAVDHGIKLPLSILAESVKGLIGGASLAVAGRPDKGKTSLLAFLLTRMAPQIEKVFAPDRPILWLNNEGPGERIVPRLYQSALALDLDELTALSNSGQLAKKYAKAVGRADRIRVKDMHGATLAQIEQVIEAMRPCVVVFDMVANFRMPSAAGGNKADEIEQKWQVIREMAVRHDFISIGTVQISNEGGDMLFPPYSALKDSKTGIQGAVDLILMMGALDDPKMAMVRGIATPKNKFQMPGKKGHVEAEVVFDAARCVFKDGG